MHNFRVCFNLHLFRFALKVLQRKKSSPLLVHSPERVVLKPGPRCSIRVSHVGCYHLPLVFSGTLESSWVRWNSQHLNLCS